MERNTNAILSLAGAGLLSAVAFAACLGTPEAEVEAPAEPTAVAAPAKAKPAVAATPGPRTVPERSAVSAYTKLPSGLEYFDVVAGSGESPKDGSLVVVEYTGWLEDGSLFDSSYNRADSFRFPVGKGSVIKGWDEGVLTMKVGGKRQLKIPGDLAYGPRGRPPKIPPDATLVFDVELKEILPPREAPAAPQKVDDSAYTTTASGLKYHDFTEGDGLVVVPGMMVEVDYTGWLQDGTKFDSSMDRAQGISFPVGTGRVIKGWDEGITGMKVGGKRQLVIPHEIAYGENGRPPTIPPAATLVFEVELISVKNAPTRTRPPH